MSSPEELNQILEAEAPAINRALSALGRRAYFPPDIPFQAGQAASKTYNSTIGQITDGRGSALPLPSMRDVLHLEKADLDRAFLYSPVPGIPELRQRWREWQRRGVAETVPSSSPLVIDGLGHGLAILADLFGGEGRAVASALPFWGNYRQTFGLRTGAEIKTAPAYRDGRFNPEVFAEALADLPAGEPAIAILNFPSNPGGYSPTREERARVRDSILAVARERPLVAICDDAYAGLVYEAEVPRESLFWELAGAHPNLLAVKVDGATKEFAFFGGRVGFVTFGVEMGSPAARALEEKVKGLVRAMVGSPVATGQVILLQALRSGEKAAAEVEVVRLALEERYLALHGALAELDGELLRPLPFNSGCFALVELTEGLGFSSEQLRQHLLEHHDVGVVSIRPHYIRLAFCSVATEALPELVRRLELGARELASAAVV